MSSKHSRRGGGSPHRRPSQIAIRREFLIFTEGLTEQDYLSGWHRCYRKQINIEFGETIGTPLTLVRAAVETKKQEERAERKAKGRESLRKAAEATDSA